MRCHLLAAMTLLVAPLHAQDHSAHGHGSTTNESTSDSALSGTDAHATLLHEHGGMRTGFLFGERFEYLPEFEQQMWEAQGWYGSDSSKLWLKTEGEYHTEEEVLEHAELQLLYSRAVAPYWDLQAGLRIDDGEGPRRHHAVIGVQGLAPYWFELDLAAFLSESGKLSARVEAEYELRFTQRLILQPRLELNYSFADDFAAGIGKGWNETSLGLRLRYEWHRQFTPYVGVEYRSLHGGTATLYDARGLDTHEMTWLGGLRFWY